jgi:hypothetical protein
MMKNIVKVSIVALAVLLVAQTFATAATVSGIAAVESRRVASSIAGTNSNISNLTVKGGVGSGAWTKVWIKWDLNALYTANPGLQGHITAADITLTGLIAKTGSTYIAGVNDSYTTNIGWTGAGATGITWSTAPANNTTTEGVTADATYLDVPTLTVVANSPLTVLSGVQNFVNFLNADTDGIVQIIMYNSSAQLDFAATTHPTQPGPKLDLTYDVPEPVTLAILGLGGLFLRRRLA